FERNMVSTQYVLHPWLQDLMGECALGSMAAWALLRRLRPAHHLAAGRADPTHRDLPDQIGAADDADKPIAVQHRYAPDPPVGEQVRHLFAVGVGADADDPGAPDICRD